jgi:UDP:flavonoid glycosyltransferase YjiC (YdhE family)
MSRRILFCWEIGEGSGHVGPYLSLLSALAERGWEVALALRNTAVGGGEVRSRWPVFQAPVCLNEFSGISGSPANHTELYLGFGFAHAPTLAGLAGGWRALFDAWRPDLVLANNAPVALLAAKASRLPTLRIGTGFECPPGGARPPLLQPWQAGLEPRLDRAEALALRNANAVLREGGAPLEESLSALLYDVPALLATVPDFDDFPRREGRFEYLGPLPDAGGGVRPRQPAEIFAYLRVQHARTSDAVEAIARTGRPALVCLPDASEAQCLAHSTDVLEVLREPADLPATLSGVRAVVCYASHAVTLAALMAGKPLLLLPDHPEQRRTAGRVAALGAGVVVTKDERPARVAAGLKRVLEEAALQQAARKFEERQTPDDGNRALARAVAACESAAVPLPVQLKVVRS